MSPSSSRLPAGSPAPSVLERAQVRRQFERIGLRSGAASDDPSGLAAEIARRMLERLEIVKLQPEVVIDAGCGTGRALPGLAARFPEARIVALDHALPLLARVQAARRSPILPEWLRRFVTAPASRPSEPVAADFGRLPFRTSSIGLIWSNLALHWASDVRAVLAEWHRALAVGGLAQFSLFGPDTLSQLRAAWERDAPLRVHRFIDMHDIGDMLVDAGFADPVMDMETVTLTYRNLDDLFADLRGAGAANVQADRPRGLTGKNRWRRMSEAYEAMRAGGTLPATFEIVYGHAWKALPRAGSDGVATFRVDDIRRTRR